MPPEIGTEWQMEATGKTDISYKLSHIPVHLTMYHTHSRVVNLEPSVKRLRFHLDSFH